MKKTNTQKMALMGFGSLLGLTLMVTDMQEVEAFEIEKVGTGDLLIPNNPISLDSSFYNSYLSSANYNTLRSKLALTVTPITITSESQYADVLAEKIAQNNPGFVLQEVLDLNALGYTYSNKILTDASGKTYDLGTASGFSSVPDDILLTNKGFDKILEANGKKERALYFYSRYGMSVSHNQSTNALTVKFIVVPHYIETIAETESRESLVNALVSMVNTNYANVSDKEKAYILYSYLTRFVTYDATSNTSSHSGSSLALDYRAVCQSIAYVYQAAGEQLGLNMHYVTGTANGENHAWNAIELDGQWYYTDATWGTYKNAKSSMDKNDGYVLYNEYFLFSDTKDSNRITTDASQKLLNNKSIVLSDKKYDSFTSYSNLGGGTYGDNMVVYKNNKAYIVHQETLAVLKEIPMGKTNHTLSKTAVVNNEYYQVFSNVLDGSLSVIITDLTTLETREFAVVENAKMLSFVDNGLLVQDKTTNELKVLLFAKTQKAQASDKLFQVTLDTSKLYYASDKALVDNGIDADAINKRLNSFELTGTKAILDTSTLTKIQADVEDGLEVKNFMVSTNEKSLTISAEFGEIEKDSLTNETIDFVIQSTNVDSEKVYQIEFTQKDGTNLTVDVTGQQLLDGTTLSSLTKTSNLLKDMESNTTLSHTLTIISDTEEIVEGYVSLVYVDEKINETTFSVSTKVKEVEPPAITTETVAVTGNEVTLSINGLDDVQNVQVIVGEEVIETTVAELNAGKKIATNGHTELQVVVQGEFTFTVTSTEVVPDPVFTTETVNVTGEKVTLSINGLDDVQNVQVIVGETIIETTVAELNAGQEIATNGNTDLKVIVEGNATFTVTATEVVVDPPVEPEEPTFTTETVTVTGDEVTLSINGLDDSQNVKVVVGEIIIETTVAELNDGQKITTNGHAELQVVVQGNATFTVTATEVVVDPPVEPEEPTFTTETITVTGDEVTLSINGLNDTQNVQVIVGETIIETTVGQLNAGQKIITNGYTELKVIVEGNATFTVTATEVVPDPPIEPEEPTFTTETVAVTGEKVTLTINGLNDAQNVQVIVGETIIETTVAELNAGQEIATNGNTDLKVIVEGNTTFTVTATEVVVDPPVEPEEPTFTTETVAVTGNEVTLSINGLDDAQNLQVVVGETIIETTVNQLNAGQKIATNGHTELKVIVEGNATFTVTATEVVVESPTDPEPPVVDPIFTTETVTVTGDTVTLTINGLDNSQNIKVVVGNTVIETTVGRLHAGQEISTNGYTEFQIIVEGETTFTVTATEVVNEKPTTIETINVTGEKVTLTINGLDNSQDVQVVVGNTVITTTVGELNAGQEIITNGHTELQVIVDDNVSFTVTATEVVPEPPVEPVQPTEPIEPPVQPTEPIEPPVQPTEPIEPPVQPTEPIQPPVQPTEPIQPPVQPEPPSNGGSGGGNSGGSGSGIDTPSTPDDSTDKVEDSEELEINDTQLSDMVKEDIEKAKEKYKDKNLTRLSTIRDINSSLQDALESIKKIKNDELRNKHLLDIEYSLMNLLIELEDVFYGKNIAKSESLRSYSNMTYVYLNRILKETNNELGLRDEINKKKIEFIHENVWKKNK